MKKIIVFTSLMSASVSAFAALKPMDDVSLSDTYGQAIFEIKEFEQIAQPNGGNPLDTLRLTIGAHIEINANVDELALGRYWRPEGSNCTGGPGGDKVCFNNDPIPAAFNKNWACTVKPCGSVGLEHKVYEASLLTHSGQALKDGKALHFYDFAGGFEPDNGVDIKLRDISLGQIRDRGDGVYEMTPFIMENPFYEFAFDKSSGTKKLVGLRIGSEDSYGYQGNIIDVISGFIKPTITADAKLLGLPLGTLNLEADLGGVRTVGWLDVKSLDVLGTSGLAGLLVDILGGPNGVLTLAATAQLYPVQSNYIKHSKAFFLSVGTRSIQWSNLGGFKSEATRPGFWLNMGGDGALISATQKGDHPKNYFPGHPNFEKYKKSKNFNNPQASWSNTYKRN